MKAVATQRVLLAGISEERLDLFLYLNPGAGYEIVGILTSAENGEPARTAEILGVDVYRDEDPESLPAADLLIHGDPVDVYELLGNALGLTSEQIWHENKAWNVLTEGPSEEHTEEVDEHDSVELVIDRPSAPADVDVRDSEVEVTDGPRRDSAPMYAVTPEAYGMLHEFARASATLQGLYEWVLRKTVEMTDAPAGGIAPAEAVRSFVWNDRRVTPEGELPGFLRGETDAPNVISIPLGEAGSPGAGELVLVGSENLSGGRRSVDELLDSISPALRTAAELDDLRRQNAWDGVIRRLASAMQEARDPADALTSTCVALAETLKAEECVLLFLDPAEEMLRGYSSREVRLAWPAGAGILGHVQKLGKPVRLLDDAGTWHVHVPFAQNERKGVMGLFRTAATPGTVDSIVHQAQALASALAPHFPAAAWKEGASTA